MTPPKSQLAFQLKTLFMGSDGTIPESYARTVEKKQLAGRTVTIKVRYADFTTVTRSHTLSLPTSDPDVISSWATELLYRTQAGRRPVRLLGARVNGLVTVTMHAAC